MDLVVGILDGDGCNPGAQRWQYWAGRVSRRASKVQLGLQNSLPPLAAMPPSAQLHVEPFPQSHAVSQYLWQVWEPNLLVQVYEA